MTYHLRYQVLPGRDATPLARYCAEHGIPEIVLIYNSEELHCGHPVGADEDLWFEHVAAVKRVLDAHGVGASLNPWVTIGHADRGRMQDRDFAPMVSPSGQVSTATASFACSVWRTWLADHYGRFAELGFRVLWLEDDFRFHNHSPLTWGGGFEPEMLERFARLSGRQVEREELVATAGAPERLGRCDDERRLAHRAISFLGGDFPLVTGGPHLMPQFATVNGRRRLALVNGSADPVRPVVSGVRPEKATLLAPLEEPRPVPVREESGYFVIDADVPHRGYVIVECA